MTSRVSITENPLSFPPYLSTGGTGSFSSMNFLGSNDRCCDMTERALFKSSNLGLLDYLVSQTTQTFRCQVSLVVTSG